MMEKRGRGIGTPRRSLGALGSLLAGVAALTVGAVPAAAAVGDLERSFLVPSEAPGSANGCSIGLAFDGQDLYYNRCQDPNIYRMTTADGDGDGDAELLGSFDSGIPASEDGPNAMAFDRIRNGLWIGTQNDNGAGDMPIYFHSFDTGATTQQFVVPDELINPATGQPFVSNTFIDGLAFDANDPDNPDDDRIWFSDDVDYNLGLFALDGTLVAGYDARTADPALSPLAGLAVGGPLLYLSNNGGGQVFRTDKTQNPLASGAQFAAATERLEDMECDNVTLAPEEVIWVRSTPQGTRADDLVGAYEIEPGTCVFGGAPGPQPITQPPGGGGACANVILGDGKGNKLSGTDGSDFLKGLLGNDKLNAGAGDDCVRGGPGSDKVGGGDGDDQLNGGQKPDKVNGGSGDDLIKVRAGRIDLVSCGPGDDTVRGEGRDIVNKDCEKVKD